MVEEFRQPIVDRAIIAAVAKDIKIETRNGILTDESRHGVANLVLQRLESEVNFRGQRHKLKSIIQIQARNLAMALRGETRYRAFSFKW